MKISFGMLLTPYSSASPRHYIQRPHLPPYDALRRVRVGSGSVAGSVVAPLEARPRAALPRGRLAAGSSPPGAGSSIMLIETFERANQERGAHRGFSVSRGHDQSRAVPDSRLAFVLRVASH